MTNTPNLALPYIDPAQAQKHVTHNAALASLDTLIHLSVKQRNVVAPPAAPNPGDRYLVGTSATGAFGGQDGKIAAFMDGVWTFATPGTGWRCFVQNENVLLVYSGGVWTDVASLVHALQNLSALGVGATADATNPLSAKLNGLLFTAKNVAEGGVGDLRMTLNKSAASNTVSQLYQNNYSGRAETGLCGDDHFHVKVSADGATWREAINVDPASGVVSFPSGVANAINTILNGANAPATSLGVNGDFYVDTLNNRFYGPKVASSWPTSFVSLVGARGNTILTLSTAPVASNGIDGDYAINSTNNRFYGPKTAGAWPTTYITLGASGASLTFAYATGDQRANITLTASAGLFVGTPSSLINGNITETVAYFNAVTLNGTQSLQFDFGAAKAINEVSYWQTPGASYGQGTWKWQGSSDATTWIDIGASFLINGAAAMPVVLTSMAGNTTAYRYYRMLGFSGSTTSAPWVSEMQFRVGS
jgi:hypothetical protein